MLQQRGGRVVKANPAVVGLDWVRSKIFSPEALFLSRVLVNAFGSRFSGSRDEKYMRCGREVYGFLGLRSRDAVRTLSGTCHRGKKIRWKSVRVCAGKDTVLVAHPSNNTIIGLAN